MCAHYLDSYRCEAYPAGIPFEIIASNTDHRIAQEGDRGLQFVPVTAVASVYAEDLFGAHSRDAAPPLRVLRLRGPRPAVV